MRRRHSVLGIALGVLLTVAVLAVGLAIETPGAPGQRLLAGAENVLRLSDPATKSVATIPAAALHGHAKQKPQTATVTIRTRAKARHAARPAAKSTVHTGDGVSNNKKISSPGTTTTTTTPRTASPAPAATPVATAPRTTTTPVKVTPVPAPRQLARADLKVASASVSKGGYVHVTLAVAKPDDAAETSALPSQLDVNMKLGTLSRTAAVAAGPMALDTALDIVPDPSKPSGARLRMRMQLASSASAAPTAPTADPNGLSNVVTLRLAMPEPALHSRPSAPPSDPTSDPGPAADPVEVQLPIASADAPTDPSSQTVQVPVPPAAAPPSDDPSPNTPAVPVAVTVTPVDPAPTPTPTPTASPTADPSATPTPTATPAS